MSIVDTFKEITVGQIWELGKYIAGAAVVAAPIYYGFVEPAVADKVNEKVDKRVEIVTQEKFDAISEVLVHQGGELEDVKADISQILQILQNQTTPE